MSADTKGLHAKLAEIMAEAESIPKNGKYTGQGSFRYVMVGDAAKVIRTALGVRGVSMLPSNVEVIGETEHETRSGGTMTTMSIRTTWTLVDSESGETATIQSIGTGADAGDKASPKAQSNAMKYALLMGFLLSTGDDPEQHDSSDRLAPPQPALDQEMRTTHQDGLVGKAITQGQQDGQLRQGPDGPSLPFRIKEGRLSQIVVAHGDLAAALDMQRADVFEKRVTVWGHYTDEQYDKGTDRIRYKVLHLERIKTPDWVLPAPVAPPEPVEAESLPLPLDEEERALVGQGAPLP